MLTKFLPWRIQNWLTNRARNRTLKRAMDTLMQDPARCLESGNTLIEELIFGWGNTAWSAERAYLEACIELALTTKGPILECGSGISTLIIATIAKKRQIPHCVLENAQEWGSKIQQRLDAFDLTFTKVNHCPIKPYGDYSWYDIDNLNNAVPFNLVICDGPPSSTEGGRFGLVPVLKTHLARGSVILLDDADREEEHLVVEKWKALNNLKVSVEGDRKPYFNIVLSE